MKRNTDPTPEQLAKLPGWAQKYIRRLTIQRDDAIHERQEVADTQTPSPFFVLRGPRHDERQYIQADVIYVTLPDSPRKHGDLGISIGDRRNPGKPGISLVTEAGEYVYRPDSGNAMMIIPPWAKGER